MRTLLMTLAALPALAVAQTDPATQAELFATGDTPALWEAMTPDMQAALGSPEELAAFHAQIVAQFGAAQGPTALSASASPLGDILFRDQVWGADGPLLRTMIVTDAAGHIAGLSVTEAVEPASTPYAARATLADLRLPFDAPDAGTWIVFWGGEALVGNYHAVDPAQRFAMDLVVHRDGVTHDGDATQRDSYFCWGEPILSPSAGTVVAAIDGLPDQAIGDSDPDNPAGNHVVIDLGTGEYLFLGHLQQGSLRVADGDTVEAGATIGLCGNSGNSSEPHLHMHLQTTPDMATGEGLPLHFRNYHSGAMLVDHGAPIRGKELAPG